LYEHVVPAFYPLKSAFCPAGSPSVHGFDPKGKGIRPGEKGSESFSGLLRFKKTPAKRKLLQKMILAKSDQQKVVQQNP